MIEATHDCRYVYFIFTDPQDDGRVNVKIGKTNDPLSRLTALQTGNPYKLRIGAVVLFKSARKATRAERGYHLTAGEMPGVDDLMGEWFQFPDIDTVQGLVLPPVYGLSDKDTLIEGEFYGRTIRTHAADAFVRRCAG